MDPGVVVKPPAVIGPSAHPPIPEGVTVKVVALEKDTTIVVLVAEGPPTIFPIVPLPTMGVPGVSLDEFLKAIGASWVLPVA